MRLALACDQGGYALKTKLISRLSANDFHITDFGSYDESSVDYPILAFAAAEAVAAGDFERGILICTTGIGMSISANKVRGVRCALCTSASMAEMTRRHNDSNILALGAVTVNEETAFSIVERFLYTDFEGGRHCRRVQQITNYEQNHLGGN